MWNVEVLGVKMGLSFQGYWGATTWDYLASVLVCKFIGSIDSQMPGLWGDLANELVCRDDDIFEQGAPLCYEFISDIVTVLLFAAYICWNGFYVALSWRHLIIQVMNT